MGSLEGCPVGTEVGSTEGTAVGVTVGCCEGTLLGDIVGRLSGFAWTSPGTGKDVALLGNCDGELVELDNKVGTSVQLPLTGAEVSSRGTTEGTEEWV